MPKKLISIVIPSYNEEKNIYPIHDEIVRHIDQGAYEYEIIFINDGSRDDTWAKIQQLSKTAPNVKGISFSRNFGHAAALQAGLEAARGDAVIMLDADLQQPPALIPDLIKHWEKGATIVNTIRLSTDNASWFKNITSKAFYRLLNSISSLELNEGEADFRLLDRRALDALNRLPESPKFYRGLVNWLGFDVVRIEYKAGIRIYGTSSFTFKKMMELARLGLTSFSMKPLKIIITVGIFMSSISFAALLAMMSVKLWINFNYFSNSVVLLTFLIFVTGLLSIFQGIVAIYLVDIFHFSKGRPAFIIGERANVSKEQATTY
jgi:glycosyltransferase involved in cell wall biosynthesis